MQVCHFLKENIPWCEFRIRYKVAREEMWRTFNCGIGYTLIVARDQAAAALDMLETLGLSAWTIGAVVPARGDERVHIR